MFIDGVLSPLAWLLGQTVPVLTNLMKHLRTDETSGYALYLSTLGSFLGSVSLSSVVMQWLGVSVAVLVCTMLLALGGLLLTERNWQTWGKALAIGVAATVINLQPNAGGAGHSLCRLCSQANHAVRVRQPPRLFHQQFPGLADG